MRKQITECWTHEQVIAYFPKDGYRDHALMRWTALVPVRKDHNGQWLLPPRDNDGVFDNFFASTFDRPVMICLTVDYKGKLKGAAFCPHLPPEVQQSIIDAVFEAALEAIPGLNQIAPPLMMQKDEAIRHYVEAEDKESLSALESMESPIKYWYIGGKRVLEPFLPEMDETHIAKD